MVSPEGLDEEPWFRDTHYPKPKDIRTKMWIASESQRSELRTFVIEE